MAQLTTIKLKAYSDVDKSCSGTARTRKFFQSSGGNIRVGWARGYARVRVRTHGVVAEYILKEVKPFEYHGFILGRKATFIMKQVNASLQVWPPEAPKVYPKAQQLISRKKDTSEQLQLPLQDPAQDLLS